METDKMQAKANETRVIHVNINNCNELNIIICFVNGKTIIWKLNIVNNIIINGNIIIKR